MAATEDQKGVRFYCPVAGMKGMKDCCPGGWCGRIPNPDLTTAYKGGVVQFCCKGCIEEFKNSPSKFAAVANHQLVATQQARQERCPVTGGPFDPAISAEIAGVVVYFANEGPCATVRNADEAQRVNLVFGDSAFGKAFRVVEKK
jgi:YHS domain-containing protein